MNHLTFVVVCWFVMAAIIGSIGEFIPENETITSYLERVQLFMDANSVKREKEVPVLLSVIGGKIYTLLRNLVAPDEPKSKSFTELTEVLKSHFEPKPNTIAERFHFYRRVQQPGESVADFVAQLKSLATHCVFEGHLDQALRDRLVCGLRNQGMQKRLLSETDLNFQKAIEIAKGMESAEKSTQQLKGPEGAIQRINNPYKRRSSGKTTWDTRASEGACYRCG